MSDLERISLSIEKSLLKRLEALVADSGYTNRSEYVRDMIRDQIVKREWAANAEAVGTITLIYDHHQRRLGEKLTDLQHDHHDMVLATTHVHLTHHLCAEMIMMKGTAAAIQALADAMRKQKGVLHANLSISSTGEELT